MNQGDGFGPLQTRGRPKGRAQRQTSSGRGVLNPYCVFSLFPPPREGGRQYKFASCIHFLLLHSKQKTTTPMHTYSAITSNEPFYPRSNISLNHIPTSPAHTHNEQPARLRAGWQSHETGSHKNFLLLVRPDILQQQTLSQYFGTSTPCSGQDPGMQVKKTLFNFQNFKITQLFPLLPWVSGWQPR